MERLPPPLTHPEFYYGFVGVALAWQLLFLLDRAGAGAAAARSCCRPSLEKLSWGIGVLVLVAQGRIGTFFVPAAVIDLLLAALFVVAWRRIGDTRNAAEARYAGASAALGPSTPGVPMRRPSLPLVVAERPRPRSTAPLHAQDEEHRTRCDQTVDLFKTNDPHLEKFFRSSVGYAIFPSVGKGAFIVGGAAGTGCLYQGGAIIGQAKLAQVTVGLQLGGQAYAEVIFFQNDDAIESFKSNSFELSAQVSAVAAASGASANAKYRLGRAGLHARQDRVDVRGVGRRPEVLVQAAGQGHDVHQGRREAQGLTVRHCEVIDGALRGMRSVGPVALPAPGVPAALRRGAPAHPDRVGRHPGPAGRRCRSPGRWSASASRSSAWPSGPTRSGMRHRGTSGRNRERPGGGQPQHHRRLLPRPASAVPGQLPSAGSDRCSCRSASGPRSSIGLVFWLYYERIMLAEEEFLRARYGKAFDDWAARTPAFLPNFRHWVPPTHAVQRPGRAAAGVLEPAATGADLRRAERRGVEGVVRGLADRPGLDRRTDRGHRRGDRPPAAPAALHPARGPAGSALARDPKRNGRPDKVGPAMTW